jgi:hypothetical protein
MLESALETLTPQMEILAPGKENFVLLAKQVVPELKLELKLMVFQIIATLVQKLLQQLLMLTLLLGGNQKAPNKMLPLQLHKML